jgi:transcriptional regulator with XRE-family HTH domain
VAKYPKLLEFGRALCRRREVLGLTQEELAERSDLTRNYISLIECAERNPSAETIVAIALGLGIAPEKFWPQPAAAEDN